MGEGNREPDVIDLVGGILNIFGLQLDVRELLKSAEGSKGSLGELRERLKAAGFKEVLSDEEWWQGASSAVKGYIRTRGPQGEQEFHIGTIGTPRGQGMEGLASEFPEVVEPMVDVLDEGKEVTIVADVPGVAVEDLDIRVEGNLFSLSTKPTAPRSYRKELRLQTEVEPDSLQVSCHNGVLQVRVHKRGTGLQGMQSQPETSTP